MNSPKYKAYRGKKNINNTLTKQRRIENRYKYNGSKQFWSVRLRTPVTTELPVRRGRIAYQFVSLFRVNSGASTTQTTDKAYAYTRPHARGQIFFVRFLIHIHIQYLIKGVYSYKNNNRAGNTKGG